jgi:IstB-like ATP binding protein
MSPSTRRGVTEQAAIAAIDSGTRVLRLPTIRDRFEEIAAAAEREQLSYLGFLAELVMAECDDRDKRRAARRIHDAGFPRDKRLEEFDFAANPGVSPAVIHQLATCAWVKAGHPLCLIGDSGTGKSHLLIGLGTAAAEAGHTGSATRWPPSSSTSWSRRLTTSSYPRRSPATAASTCSASMSWDTWNSTGTAPNSCSRS